MGEKIVRLHENDAIAVALTPIAKGEKLICRDMRVSACDDIPMGHKIALSDISAGSEITKFNQPIGLATADIRRGNWVHTHNLETGLSGVRDYAYDPGQPVKLPTITQGKMFEGFLRPDGRAGTRNEIWIINTVGCCNQVSAALASQACTRFADAPIDGIFDYAQPYGCSQIGEDLLMTQKILAGLAKNPNAGGVLVVGLGCEVNHINEFRRFLEPVDESRLKFLRLQDYQDELAEGLKLLDELVAEISQDCRTSLPLSKLVVGLECGGSDGFSSITANPLVGMVSDRLVGAGATVILSEVPEMFGAELNLMHRACNRDVFAKTADLINKYKDYLMRYGQEVHENPSPGNKAGGISTLEEKSLGCILKGGSAPVVDVLDYGEPVTQPGLNLLNGPGNDLVSVTVLTASGSQLQLFTTGRGTPLGAPVPTVKIATNSSLARRKPGWIDFDAGVLVTGETFETQADLLLQEIIDIASGRKRTRNEINGYRQITLMKDGVIM